MHIFMNCIQAFTLIFKYKILGSWFQYSMVAMLLFLKAVIAITFLQCVCYVEQP